MAFLKKQYSNKKRSSKIWIGLLLLMILILATAFYPLPDQQAIQFIDRETGVVQTEKVAGEKWLVWLYNNPVGEATLWALVKRKIVSSIYGDMMDSPSSAEKIEPFVAEFGIDLSIAQKQHFDSFNDFFTRKLKAEARPVDTASGIVVSPADGKVLAWQNVSDADFIVKGYRFDVFSFLENDALAEKFKNGSLIVIRLAPNDYHRFHFPVGGHVSEVVRIDGDYFSVNPIALKKMAEIFILNKREYVVINNVEFGNVVMAEVGATMVGSIIQTYESDTVIKGDEKGYFEFGGSTVVLLFEKGRIVIDEDLLENTAEGFETRVEMGEGIGRWLHATAQRRNEK